MKKEKTILEWLEQAKSEGYEWADAAIDNAISTKLESLDEISLSEAIAGAFSWDGSIQGHEYWHEIYTHLIGKEK